MRILSLLTVFALMVVGASAAIVNPTGIGVGTDANYTITSPSAQAATIADGTETTAFNTAPTWATPAVRWIYPSSTFEGEDVGPTTWVYETTIDLTFLDAATADILLDVFVDGRVTDLRVGGVTLTGFAEFGGFASSNSVAINSSNAGLVAGVQTLEFDVYNGPIASGTNVTGLRVDVIRASAVPEPGTYALVGLGLAGLALIRRRRTS